MTGSRATRGGIATGLGWVFGCILISTVGFKLIEGWSFLDAFYMTIITISTVGYSEVNSLSPDGRLFASFVILTGLGAAFYTTTMLGRMILEGEFRGTVGRRKMRRKIDDLRGHSIVCGFGRTGGLVAELLDEDGYAFCVIENNRDKEEDLRDSGYLYLMGDATEADELREAGVERAHAVMALLPSDADNLYLTMTAKELNPNVLVVARAFDYAAEMRLKRGGADNVVSMHKIAAHRVIQGALRPAVEEFVDLVTDRQQLSLFVEEVKLFEGSGLNGLAIKDAGVRTRYGVIIVTIKKATGEMIFNPDAGEILMEGDTIVAIGEKTNLNRLLGDCQPASSK
ncbi:MAG: potassium channel protein [Candidatus Latescibacterota bacterium]|nr:MAG: potassium channel protein [Candidatus Latescibacterota bacterium]